MAKAGERVRKRGSSTRMARHFRVGAEPRRGPRERVARPRKKQQAEERWGPGGWHAPFARLRAFSGFTK